MLEVTDLFPRSNGRVFACALGLANPTKVTEKLLECSGDEDQHRNTNSEALKVPEHEDLLIDTFRPQTRSPPKVLDRSELGRPGVFVRRRGGSSARSQRAVGERALQRHGGAGSAAQCKLQISVLLLAAFGLVIADATAVKFAVADTFFTCSVRLEVIPGRRY